MLFIIRVTPERDPLLLRKQGFPGRPALRLGQCYAEAPEISHESCSEASGSPPIGSPLMREEPHFGRRFDSAKPLVRNEKEKAQGGGLREAGSWFTHVRAMNSAEAPFF